MKNKITKYCLLCILIGCLSISYTSLSATSKVSNINSELSNALSIITNIQKQFTSLSVSAYTNNLESHSNADTLKTLELSKDSIVKLAKELTKYQSSVTSDKLQKAKLQSLIASTDMLKYMADALIDYVKSSDSYDQLQFLKLYFKLDALLSQFIIDFNYFDTTSPSIRYSN